MAPDFISTPAVPDDADVLGVPVFTDLSVPSGAGATLSRRFLKTIGFEARPGQTERLQAADGSVIVAVGVGPADQLDADALRRAGAGFVRAVGPARRAAVTISGAARGRVAAGPAAQAVVEGIALGGYRFTAHKAAAAPSSLASLESVAVVGGDRSGVRRGQHIAAAVRRARDWVNEPPRSMTPRRLAAAAEQLAFDTGLDVYVWDEERLVSERMGGLLGVAAGSAEPPRLVRLAYEPSGARATVALVGKGITFDSGGLSLKTNDGMRTMKGDMGGAAAVLSAMGALAGLGVKVRVVGYACCTENMPSGTATHVGDVLTARNGRTIEVLNTDAEGRLVMADGLSLAAEETPDAIIDLATLTGGQRVALGNQVAALMANHDGLADQLVVAARRAGEPAWRLPLWPGYRSHLDSEVADMKNIGQPNNASAIIGGLFLQEFVAGRPWAHLDIASPSWSDVDDGWMTKGATGWGVRTLLEWLREWEPLRS
ncbi:MAG TPA: leucyl aminopeptidase [Acidimicrobiales bacterium]|nr:leucyl aminopeptidase [Acidimicrobiales bacterium]